MPTPVVRLRPIDPNVVWVAGRAVVAQERGGVRVAAAFDHQARAALGFRVEVQNVADKSLEIAPDDFVFVTCTTEESCARPRRVVDPEAMLIALDQKQAAEEAAATNQAILGSTLLLLSVATDVASVASGRADRSTGTSTMLLGQQLGNDEARLHRTQMDIEQNRQVWSGAALRRTTLLPGRALAGHVYVPIDLSAREVWIGLRPDRQDRIWFRFKQAIHSPQQSSPQSSQSSVMRGKWAGY
jgi:hypothetical protein